MMYSINTDVNDEYFCEDMKEHMIKEAKIHLKIWLDLYNLKINSGKDSILELDSAVNNKTFKFNLSSTIFIMHLKNSKKIFLFA